MSGFERAWVWQHTDAAGEIDETGVLFTEPPENHRDHELAYGQTYTEVVPVEAVEAMLRDVSRDFADVTASVVIGWARARLRKLGRCS